MTLGSRLRRLLFVCPLVGVVAGMSLASGRTASADTADKTELNERCATRLSIALLGRSPDATLFASATPQASVNGMLLSQDFIERFSRFVNARFNPTPGVTQDEDAAYFMAKRVLAEGKPWQDMFVGPYRVENGAAVDDPNGLGYFRSPAWLKRYAGNEGAGPQDRDRRPHAERHAGAQARGRDRRASVTSARRGVRLPGVAAVTSRTGTPSTRWRASSRDVRARATR